MLTLCETPCCISGVAFMINTHTHLCVACVVCACVQVFSTPLYIVYTCCWNVCLMYALLYVYGKFVKKDQEHN